MTRNQSSLITTRTGLLLLPVAACAAVWVFGARAAFLAGAVGIPVWIVLEYLIGSIVHGQVNKPIPAPPSPVAGVIVDPGEDLATHIKRVGWIQFRGGNRHDVIDACPDPGSAGLAATLYRFTEPPWAGTHVLEVFDATPENGVRAPTGLVVPNTYRSAKQALASRGGFTVAQYQPTRAT